MTFFFDLPNLNEINQPQFNKLITILYTFSQEYLTIKNLTILLLLNQNF